MSFPSSLSIPEEVLRIAQELEDAGFETWCVGGAVRDNLLGFENQDFDLTTAARPQDVQQLFRRTVPVGIEHGTVAVLDRHHRPHEVTTFRLDVVTDGRHAQVEFGASLDDDLARRDFTINAIAYHPLKHEWRDRFGGAADLEGKLIRAVGDPAQRFREDYLRILRALRFAARFHFVIEPATWEAAKANIDGLGRLSAERVREEWFRGLTASQRPSELLELWREGGAGERWLPETGPGAGGEGTVEPGALTAGAWPVAEGPAPRSPLLGTDRLPRDPVLTTSFLSSDPEKTLSRLKCSRAEIERGQRIAAHRAEWPEPTSEVAVRRWLAKVGPAAPDLLAIARALGRGDELSTTVQRIGQSNAPLTLGDLAIKGDDLLAMGIPRGPAIGQTLRALLERVLDEPSLNTKEQLLDLARRLTSGPAPRQTAPRPDGERGEGSGTSPGQAK
jgi:tRNA nucleotidyltransferase (CCA-adding enzyme)